MHESSSPATPVQGRMLIGGRWRDAADGRTLNVENPATRQVFGTIPRGDKTDVNAAVAAATSAFEKWRTTTAQERSAMLRAIADGLSARAEEVARCLARETGNALRTQARPEVQNGVDILMYFAGLTTELKGETVPGESVLSYTRREPLGVVAGVIPWNAPLAIGVLKIAPAIAAGNTVVIKAAEDASLNVLLLAEICHEVLPPGVVNVVTGLGQECGANLVNHPGIHKLTFTGSTGVGRIVATAAADRIIPVSLELGGKSPCIVFADSDTKETVQGVMTAMRFTRQSQSCTAGSRLFLHQSIYDSFLESLANELEKYRIGDPLDEDTDIGAIINEKQFRRVCGYIEEGMARPEGRLVTGGLPPSEGPLSKGYFTQPTVFANASNDWRLAQEEIFGPVLVAIPWTDEHEVVRMANDTHYGLAGYVWTRDIAVALRTAHALDTGWVQVNRGGGQSPGLPYGGYKASGLGTEMSLESMLHSFTQVKAVTVNLNG